MVQRCAYGAFGALLGVALLLQSGFFPSRQPAPSVDVLELQRLVADVISGAAEHRVKDVNHDGRVDILDLQVLMAQAQTRAPIVPPAPEDNPPRAIISDRGEIQELRPAAQFGLPPGHHDGCMGEEPGGRRWEPKPLNMARYVFRLHPHAPPVAM